MRGVVRRLAAAVLASLIVLISTSGADRAWAHASLVHSDPADGAVLAAPPRHFVLHFNELVSPLALRLIQADGRAVDLPRPKPAPMLTLDAPPLGNGSYALSWRVVSEDGHPVGGSLLFSVGEPLDRRLTANGPVGDPIARVGLWLARLLIVAGLTFGVGSVVIRTWFEPAEKGPQTWALALFTLGFAGCVLLPGLQGLDALDLLLSALANGVAWRTGASTTFGTTALLAGAAFVLAGIAATVPQSVGRWLALGALLVGVLAPAASGHAASADPKALMLPAVIVHVLGAALWLGVLVPLFLGLRNGHRGAVLLGRLTSLLPVPVAALAISGVVLAVVQLGSPAALLDTAYGWVLLVKLGAVLVFLGLAALNRWAWTAPAVAGDGRAQAQLSRSLAAEIAVGVAILAIVGLWRFTPPPRALAEAKGRPVTVHLFSSAAMAEVTLTPGRAGPLDASMVIMTGDFGPLDAKEVELVFARPDLGLEPIRRAAVKPGDGTWAVSGLTLPVAGRWNVRVDILVSDFQKATFQGQVDIRP